MPRDHKRQLEILEKTRNDLERALDAIETRRMDTNRTEAATLEEVLNALRALDTLREFVIQDLGTAVHNLQSMQRTVSELGSYVDNQREAVNDLSGTLAALVDLLAHSGVVDPEALLKKKTSILSAVEAPPKEPDGMN